MSAPTIIPSAYSLGQFAPVDERPEKPRPDPAADRLAYSQVLKHFGWSEADYQRAKEFGFPVNAYPARFDSGPFKGQAIYSRRRVTEWAAQVKRLAAALGA